MSDVYSKQQREMDTSLTETASDIAFNSETNSIFEATETESIETPTDSSIDLNEVSNISSDNSGDEGIGDIMEDPEALGISVSAPVELTQSIPSILTALEKLPAINQEAPIRVAVIDEFAIDSSTELDEENSADTLTPLMMDNHVYIEDNEVMKSVTPQSLYEVSGGIIKISNPPNAQEPISPSQNKTMSSDCSNNFKAMLNAELNSGHIEKCDWPSDENNSLLGINKTIEEDQPVQIPDEAFCEKIVEQVEFYFSDESLLKDAFLLKHVRRNKEGYVSLKLVSSFKRVRALVKDWRVVAVAIKSKSQKIELNDIETKIRRIEPLPLYDETTPSRTVVATNLPFDKLTIEKAVKLFSKCGEIALVRILRPNSPIPADVRQFVNKHPELQQNECALIEFTESAAARRALQLDEIVVHELVLPKKKTGKKVNNVTKIIENFHNSENDNERSRGGEIINSTNHRFYLQRNNSGSNFIRTETPGIYQFQPRKMSLGNESLNVYSPPFSNFHPQQPYYDNQQRRMSNVCSSVDRKFSNYSDDYSGCSEIHSRRQSLTSDHSLLTHRRLSNSSEPQNPSSSQWRRSSISCSDHCSCSRRFSEYSNDSLRRLSSTSSDFHRKISSGSVNYCDRKYSSASISCDATFDRKISPASINCERKYSSSFDPIRKLSQTSDHYINGRKISTDSGYDRRTSINSITYDNDNPIIRSRNNSLVCPNHPSNELLVREPIG